jgi:hypothetical protein
MSNGGLGDVDVDGRDGWRAAAPPRTRLKNFLDCHSTVQGAFEALGVVDPVSGRGREEVAYRTAATVPQGTCMWDSVWLAVDRVADGAGGRRKVQYCTVLWYSTAVVRGVSRVCYGQCYGIGA